MLVMRSHTTFWKINMVCNWNDVLVVIKAISNWQLAEIKTLQNQRTSSLQFQSLKDYYRLCSKYFLVEVTPSALKCVQSTFIGLHLLGLHVSNMAVGEILKFLMFETYCLLTAYCWRLFSGKIRKCAKSDLITLVKSFHILRKHI